MIHMTKVWRFMVNATTRISMVTVSGRALRPRSADFFGRFTAKAQRSRRHAEGKSYSLLVKRMKKWLLFRSAIHDLRSAIFLAVKIFLEEVGGTLTAP